jgi:predicted MFS family arabinose efflux permease
MPILAAVAAAGFLSTMVMRMTDPLTPVLAVEFGVPAASLAVMSTAYALPYAIFQLVLAPFGDRFGKLRVVRLAAVMLSVFVAATALAPGFGSMLAARFASGAMGGGIIPLGLAIIGDRVALERRQVTISRFMAAVLIGQVTGAFLTGVLAEFLPWRLVLGGYAAIGLAIGLGLFAVRAEPPAAPAPLHPLAILERYRTILKRPIPRTLLTLVALEGALIYGYLMILPAMLTELRGLGTGPLGVVVGAFGLGGLAYTLTLPLLIRFAGPHRMLVAGGLIGGVAGLAGLTPLPSALYPVVTFGLGTSFYLMHSNFQTRATEIAPDARGAGMALFSCCFFLGNGAGPWVNGHLAPMIGYTGPMAATALLIAGFGALAATKLHRVDRLHGG